MLVKFLKLNIFLISKKTQPCILNFKKPLIFFLNCQKNIRLIQVSLYMRISTCFLQFIPRALNYKVSL